jgi:hypothetical protein
VFSTGWYHFSEIHELLSSRPRGYSVGYRKPQSVIEKAEGYSGNPGVVEDQFGVEFDDGGSSRTGDGARAELTMVCDSEPPGSKGEILDDVTGSVTIEIDGTVEGLMQRPREESLSYEKSNRAAALLTVEIQRDMRNTMSIDGGGKNPIGPVVSDIAGVTHVVIAKPVYTAPFDHNGTKLTFRSVWELVATLPDFLPTSSVENTPGIIYCDTKLLRV